MPVKIRLSRQGRKKKPFYYIVVTDSRTPRDGRFIERIGSYDPNSNPATIDLEFDKALSWLQKGAQPTDTCRAILSYRGVLYKHHLLKGVKKGAFDEATAEGRFESWLKEKENKIDAKIDKLAQEKKASEKKRFEAETKVSEARTQKLTEKNAEEAKKAAAAKEAEKADNAEAVEIAPKVTAPVETTDEKAEAVTDEKVEAVTEKKAETATDEKVEAVTDEKAEAATDEKVEAVTNEKAEAATDEKVEAVTDEKAEAATKEKVEAVTEKKAEAETKEKTEKKGE